MSKLKPKQNKVKEFLCPFTIEHIHSFKIERGGGDSKAFITFYDMACDCGLKMMVHNPTIHRGDMCERKIKFGEKI